MQAIRLTVRPCTITDVSNAPALGPSMRIRVSPAFSATSACGYSSPTALGTGACRRAGQSGGSGAKKGNERSRAASASSAESAAALSRALPPACAAVTVTVVTAAQVTSMIAVAAMTSRSVRPASPARRHRGGFTGIARTR